MYIVTLVHYKHLQKTSCSRGLRQLESIFPRVEHRQVGPGILLIHPCIGLRHCQGRGQRAMGPHHSPSAAILSYVTHVHTGLNVTSISQIHQL